LAVEPPPVSRETLEGSSERVTPYHGLPGGIVLGLEARGLGGLERELAGARIEQMVSGELVLRLADGRVLRCPKLAPETLRACLAFIAAERDALVDLASGFSEKPRVAPAFADSALADLLVRMDGVPHRERPETRIWKSLILDRDVCFEARGEELVLSADLEVRFYHEDGGSGWARRARTLEALGPAFVGPRCASDLSAELAPLAEIAGWLGFLRRLAKIDSAGFAALR
jgi:hypothetical protein